MPDAMNDIFDKIIAREIPAQFVYEDNICVVVMDKFPVVEGQVLIIPRDCEAYAFRLPDATYAHILMVAKRIAGALDKTYNTLRTCLLIEGFEVAHTHIKLYPVTKREFHVHGGSEVSNESLQIEAEKIKANLV